MLAFIHIEATVGTAVTSLLRQSFGLRHCDLASWSQYREEYASPGVTDLKRALLFYPSLESISGHIVTPHCGYEQLRSDIRYFTFLSEPLDRCASHYQHQRQTMHKDTPPFEEWIQQEVYRNFMTKKLAGTGKSDDAIQTLETRVGCTGLTEQFDESLLLLRRWANHPRVDIRYREQGVSAHDDIKRQLLTDARSRERLMEANEEDRRLYFYVANELLPRQLAGYGSSLEADLAAFRSSNRSLRLSPRDLPSLVYRHAVYRRAAQLNTAIRRAA